MAEWMTHRERYLNLLRGLPVDRVPDYEFGAWDQTYPRWHGEGMPARHTDCDRGIVEHFHTDEEAFGPVPWVNVGLCPGFAGKVLEEKGDHLIMQDGDGATVEMMKSDLGASIPRYLRYAIETRKDWEAIRNERLILDDPRRFPPDLEALCWRTHTAEYPVWLSAGALYGWLRNWMGVERLSEALYEDPAWIEEMMEHLTLLMLTGYARIAGKCRIDSSHWWEDMCYKSGPLLSPAMFKRLMVPRYRRVTDFLRRECGCAFNVLDCDGRINELVPLWLDGGINVMFPLEAPHTDAFAIVREVGGRVVLRGYFDKRALIAGPAAIDREFDRIAPLLKRGRFIPHTDHRVPPDVSLANYRYYRRRKCAILGKPYREG